MKARVLAVVVVSDNHTTVAVLFAAAMVAVLGITLLSPSSSPSARTVSRAPGTKLVKGPSDVSLGGRLAKHLVLTVRERVGSDPGFFYTWRTGSGGAFWRTTDVGDKVRVWIVTVNGKHLFIAAATKAAGLEKEIQQIVESIRFA